MSALPLIAHDRPDAIIAYRRGQAISAAQFLHDVRALAARLLPGTHLLNFCSDRYRFAVGLAAGLSSGKCSILPSTHTPEVIRHLRAFAPDVFCLSDDPQCPLALPQLLYDDSSAPNAQAGEYGEFAVPQIDAGRLAAYVFTSGSTGAPVPHPKIWGRLVQCVRAEVTRLPLAHLADCAILATVPAQHMYGLESSVLLPLQSGSALCAERPFFPADIAAALAALPRERDDPAHGERAGATGGNLDRHLVVGAADAARLHFDHRLDVVQGDDEDLERVLP